MVNNDYKFATTYSFMKARVVGRIDLLIIHFQCVGGGLSRILFTKISC